MCPESSRIPRPSVAPDGRNNILKGCQLLAGGLSAANTPGYVSQNFVDPAGVAASNSSMVIAAPLSGAESANSGSGGVVSLNHRLIAETPRGKVRRTSLHHASRKQRSLDHSARWLDDLLLVPKRATAFQPRASREFCEPCQYFVAADESMA